MKKVSCTGTVLWFGLVGLVSGLTNGIVFNHGPEPFGWARFFLIPGGLFGVALLLGMLLALREGWINLDVSFLRWVIGIGGVIFAWPAGVYSVLFAISLLGDTALVPSAAIGGVFVSVSMRVLTKRWVWESVMLLCTTGLLLMDAAATGNIDILSMVWFLAGQFLFGVACGYWMLRASIRGGEGTGTASPEIVP